jgi:two-component system sensor histidine kinase DegS
MPNYKNSAVQMDDIVNKAIKALDLGKKEIIEIAESSRKECKNLENELVKLKEHVYVIINEIDELEHKLKLSKKKLYDVNKDYNSYSQSELANAYQSADNLRVEVAVKREQERYLIGRRNDLEIRIRDSIKTLERADNLIGHVGVALGYLSGDLKEVGEQLDSLQQNQYMGLRIIEAQEDERKRFAREIHDGPAQSMSNILIKAEVCEKLIDKNTEDAKKELQNLKKIMRDSLQEVRKIIYNLRPMALDDLGLLPTLERYVISFQENSGIDVVLRARNFNNELKSAISLTAFRIVQEGLNNVLKHSQAKNASVSLEQFNNNLSIVIVDNGIGFNPNDIKEKNSSLVGGFGLYSMKERVSLLKGEFEVISEKGQGTKIKVLIPLINDEEALGK